MKSPSVRTDGIQVGPHQGQVAPPDPQVAHAEPADQLALDRAGEGDAARVVVVDAGAVVGERIHPVGQRIVVDRDQEVGARALRQHRPGARDRRRCPSVRVMRTLAPASSSSCSSPERRSPRLASASRRPVGPVAPPGGWPGSTAISRPRSGCRRRRSRRPTDVEQQVAPIPAGVIAPDRLAQSSKPSGDLLAAGPGPRPRGAPASRPSRSGSSSRRRRAP